MVLSIQMVQQCCSYDEPRCRVWIVQQEDHNAAYMTRKRPTASQRSAEGSGDKCRVTRTDSAEVARMPHSGPIGGGDNPRTRNVLHACAHGLMSSRRTIVERCKCCAVRKQCKRKTSEDRVAM